MIGGHMGAAEDSQITPSRRGPRGGGDTARAEILNASIAVFAEVGYQSATIKAIAAQAGVDTKLVHYYFGTKADLFAATMSFLFADLGLRDQLLAVRTPGEGQGARYIKTALTFIEESDVGPAFLALIRSVGTHDESRRIMLTFIESVLHMIEGGEPEAQMRYRASLLGTQMLGLFFVRYILKNPVLANVPIDQLAHDIGPTIDRYLGGSL